MSFRVVFLDRSTLGPTVNITRPEFDHDWIEYDRTQQDQVVERLAGASIAITNKVPIRREALERLPNLKMIAVAATGYDVIDVEACRELGVVVSNVRGYAVNTVPEHVLALMFALRRSIVPYREDVIAGEWQKAAQFCFFNHPIKDLSGSTLGVVGRGAIGSSIGRLGEALGMRVIYAGRKGVDTPPAGCVAFDQFLKESDVITLNCPLTPETRDLIGAAEFAKMDRKPFLINAGRGGLVNELALVDAVESGQIAAAGFDCLTSEPISDDHPFHKILTRPNVIVTPHVAWASEEAMQTLWDQVIFHINNFNKGEPSNLVC